MIYYESKVEKALKKGDIPMNIFKNIHNAFSALDLTNDFNLFDIRKMTGNYTREYYRLRKDKYRAIFYVSEHDFHVIFIGKREEVYDLWQ